MVENQVGPIAYHLKLSPALQRLHPVFYVVKLTLASKDPISGKCSSLPSDLIIINGKEK